MPKFKAGDKVKVCLDSSMYSRERFRYWDGMEGVVLSATFSSVEEEGTIYEIKVVKPANYMYNGYDIGDELYFKEVHLKCSTPIINRSLTSGLQL